MRLTHSEMKVQHGEAAIQALNKRMGGGNQVPVIIGSDHDGKQIILNRIADKHEPGSTTKKEAILLDIGEPELLPDELWEDMHMHIKRRYIAAFIASLYRSLKQNRKPNTIDKMAEKIDGEDCPHEAGEEMCVELKRLGIKMLVIDHTEHLWLKPNGETANGFEYMDAICDFFEGKGIRTAFSGNSSLYRHMKIAELKSGASARYKTMIIPRITNNGEWRMIAKSEIMNMRVDFRLTDKRADRLFHMANGSVTRLKGIIRAVAQYAEAVRGAGMKGNNLNILDVLDTHQDEAIRVKRRT